MRESGGGAAEVCRKHGVSIVGVICVLAMISNLQSSSTSPSSPASSDGGQLRGGSASASKEKEQANLDYVQRLAVAALPEDSVYRLSATDIDGRHVEFSKYAGKLNELYAKYHERGLEILAFPCDQFNQEAGSDADIKAFVEENYGIKFDLYAKTEISGGGAHPVYQLMQTHLPGEIRWNFFKYLLNRQGMPVAMFGTKDLPLDIEADIVAQLDLQQDLVAGEEKWSESAMADMMAAGGGN